jgi:hypothetical protein
VTVQDEMSMMAAARFAGEPACSCRIILDGADYSALYCRRT